MSVSSRVRSVFVGAALVLVATLGIAAPASAHDALDGSDPVSGTSVEVAPSQITLNFTADLMPDGAEAQVFAGTDPVAASQAGETDWTAGAATVDGPSLIIPLQEAMPAGTYSVNWRVVSSDGHAISTSSAEVVTFTVTVGADVAEPTAEPTTEPTEDAVVEPAPSETADAVVVSESPEAAEELAGVSPVVIWVLVLGGAALIVLLAFVVRLIRK